MPEKLARLNVTKLVIVAPMTEVEINYLLASWGVHWLNSQMTMQVARMNAGERTMCGTVSLTCRNSPHSTPGTSKATTKKGSTRPISTKSICASGRLNCVDALSPFQTRNSLGDLPMTVRMEHAKQRVT